MKDFGFNLNCFSSAYVISNIKRAPIYLGSFVARWLEHSEIHRIILRLEMLYRRCDAADTYHWHTIILVEWLIRHRLRIDSWDTWRINAGRSGCSELIYGHIVERRWLSCIINSTICGHHSLFLYSWGNIQFSIPQHHTLSLKYDVKIEMI